MRATLRAVGELSITAGLILMLFCAYLLWGTGAYTQSQQSLLKGELAAKKPRAERIRPGQALAMLRIPRLGRDYQYAVVEGVGAEQLKRGPGHYPDSAMPGEVGNFVLSGHRTTYAAPFNEIDELERDDEIVVETPEARHTYRVTSQDIVRPDEIDVLAPVPGKPDIRPIRAFITLSTCHPEYSAAERLIVYGVLKESEPREE
ncbi:sortase family protein [[Actinomadura] parvosata subsp. kistnae]|uniref:Class E sortase n=1 Tax=[Actinomadura] parvosata subsp. kistnae TaxID=1909395 RepID=A0A1V0AC50_9ACTN|nr:class E sortase [Nonomuraea sp. ATCC 55076]AQZ67702.1 class E sortase [Nonomuraea sp. ATCC 55076]SPL94009.1 sortase family protein [Actinomadura parvosata subsp. kistnae]